MPELDRLLTKAGTGVEGLGEKKEGGTKKYRVSVLVDRGSPAKIAQAVAGATGMSVGAAAKKVLHPPAYLEFSTKSEAMELIQKIFQAGGKAKLETL